VISDDAALVNADATPDPGNAIVVIPAPGTGSGAWGDNSGTALRLKTEFSSNAGTTLLSGPAGCQHGNPD
jgi:hypothetical protein